LDFHAKIFVDSGALLEKEWAVQAGLGFWGKNCAVISPSKGSFFHIGCMLLDAGDCPSDCPDDRPDDRPDVYPDDHPLDRLCGSCRRCVDACPGHAISPEGYGIFFEKCVSYLTQKKGPLTETEIGSMSDHLYGCDVCQQVCPFNAGSCSESFRPESLRVSLDWILQMTPEEFARTLQPTAAGWRGLEILKRNARIALVNGSNGSNGLN
jgi:epoxyqueuosine reductase